LAEVTYSDVSFLVGKRHLVGDHWAQSVGDD